MLVPAHHCHKYTCLSLQGLRYELSFSVQTFGQSLCPQGEHLQLCCQTKTVQLRTKKWRLSLIRSVNSVPILPQLTHASELQSTGHIQTLLAC